MTVAALSACSTGRPCELVTAYTHADDSDCVWTTGFDSSEALLDHTFNQRLKAQFTAMAKQQREVCAPRCNKHPNAQCSGLIQSILHGLSIDDGSAEMLSQMGMRRQSWRR